MGEKPFHSDPDSSTSIDDSVSNSPTLSGRSQLDSPRTEIDSQKSQIDTKKCPIVTRSIPTDSEIIVTNTEKTPGPKEDPVDLSGKSVSAERRIFLDSMGKTRVITESTRKIACEDTSENRKHDYNCDCFKCQSKYGSLPLLVQVIEDQRTFPTQERMASSPPDILDESARDFQYEKSSGHFSHDETSSGFLEKGTPFHCSNEDTSSDILQTDSSQEESCECSQEEMLVDIYAPSTSTQCQDPLGESTQTLQTYQHNTVSYEASTSSSHLPEKYPKNLRRSPSTSPLRSSVRQLVCPHCGKVLTHKGDFNKHLRKHTGEQPFSCTICDKKFAHTSNLARHLRVHSGDRPFECSICGKKFSRRDKMQMHQKSKLCRKHQEFPPVS